MRPSQVEPSKPEAPGTEAPKPAPQPAVQPKRESPRPQPVQAKPEPVTRPQPVLPKTAADPSKPVAETRPEAAAPQPAVETKPEAAPPQPVVETKPEPQPQIAPTPPVLIRRVSPIYPEDARREGIQGAVQLQIDIDENGVPSNPRVVRSLHPSLDERAKEAVVLWRFRPGTVDGKPAPASVRVEVNFSLVGAPARTAPSLKKR